jgi:hypothetical protein
MKIAVNVGATFPTSTIQLNQLDATEGGPVVALSYDAKRSVVYAVTQKTVANDPARVWTINAGSLVASEPVTCVPEDFLIL